MVRLPSTLLFLALLAPVPLAAQEVGRVRLAIAGGPTLNDLEAGGVLWLTTVGVEWRPASLPFVLDSSVRYLTYSAAEREHYPLVEVSAQWELRAGPISPFLGGGGGLAWRLRPGDSDMNASTHVAVGLRAALGSRAGLRAEARLRSLEPLGEFTLGLSWGLGGAVTAPRYAGLAIHEREVGRSAAAYEDHRVLARAERPRSDSSVRESPRSCRA